MTEQQLREQAELRYEREQQEQRLREEAEREADKESGIRDHIERIQRQRDEERREQARKEAKRKADALASRRAEIEREMGDHLATYMRARADLLALDAEQRGLLREAGEHTTHDGVSSRPRYEPFEKVEKEWLRGHLREIVVTDEREFAMIRRFGYPEARPLAEIDPLADVTSYDDEEAS
jgi:hypothetical protein